MEGENSPSIFLTSPPPKLLAKMKDKLSSGENISEKELTEWICELEVMEDRLCRLGWIAVGGESMGK